MPIPNNDTRALEVSPTNQEARNAGYVCEQHSDLIISDVHAPHMLDPLGDDFLGCGPHPNAGAPEARVSGLYRG